MNGPEITGQIADPLDRGERVNDDKEPPVKASHHSGARLSFSAIVLSQLHLKLQYFERGASRLTTFPEIRASVASLLYSSPEILRVQFSGDAHT